jgi:hypothetical protein
MILRFSKYTIYPSKKIGMYKHTYAQEPFYPLSCTVEIVQISEQDNIETLPRYFQYTANVLHIKQRAKKIAENLI